MSLLALGLLGCALGLLVASGIVYRELINLSNILRLPAFLISLVLLAISTSTPELSVGVTSALRGEPSFSLGDILGSNIVNLTFIAGTVILLSRKRIFLPNYIGSGQLLGILALGTMPTLLLLDGVLSRIDGIILLSLYVLYVFRTVTHWNNENTNLQRPAAGPLAKSLGKFAFGALLLVLSAIVLIKISSEISVGLNIPPFVVGIFAIAFSTSLPEFVFGLRAAFQKRPELSLANLVGATAVNASGILGLVTLIHPIAPIDIFTVLLTGSFGIVTFLVFFFAVGKGVVEPSRGIVLLFLYLLFVSFGFVLKLNTF